MESEKQENWRRVRNRYTPEEIFYLLGPSARTCFGPIRNTIPKTDDTSADFAHYLTSVDLANKALDLRYSMHGAEVPLELQAPKFHRFFFTEEPAQNPSTDLNIRYYVPTPLLREMLWREFRPKVLSGQLKLASLFHPFPYVLAALYEPLVLSVLQYSEEPLTCYIPQENSGFEPESFLLGPRLKLSSYLFIADLPFYPTDCTIYVPPSGFTSLDAFIVSEGMTHVTILQMTIAKSHDLKPAGLSKLVNAFRAAEQREKGSVKFPTKWSYLFVTPEDTGRTIAAHHRRPKLPRGSPSVRVGWTQVPYEYAAMPPEKEEAEEEREEDDEIHEEDEGADEGNAGDVGNEGGQGDKRGEDDEDDEEQQPRKKRQRR